MTEPRRQNPLDAALDVMVFAPIGLLASYRKILPEMAAKGRKVVDQQVSVARFVGRFAVRQGQQQAAKSAQRVLSREPSAEVADQHIPVRLEGASSDGATPDTLDAVDADELAIPQYDALAASQVVARLDGLTANELDAVRRYELAHRGRKTVLGKIDQLRRH